MLALLPGSSTYGSSTTDIVSDNPDNSSLITPRRIHLVLIEFARLQRQETHLGLVFARYAAHGLERDVVQQLSGKKLPLTAVSRPCFRLSAVSPFFFFFNLHTLLSGRFFAAFEYV